MNGSPICTILKGSAASGGIGVGRIFILRAAEPLAGKKNHPQAAPGTEITRYRAARDRVWTRFGQARPVYSGNSVPAKTIYRKDPSYAGVIFLPPSIVQLIQAVAEAAHKK